MIFNEYIINNEVIFNVNMNELTCREAVKRDPQCANGTLPATFAGKQWKIISGRSFWI
jgi:hypothetical protein